jgi:hypothetical protein
MRSNIRFCKDSCGVIKFWRSHWDRGICSLVSLDHGSQTRGLIETAEILTKNFTSEPLVSVRLQNLQQKCCPIPRLNATAETAPAVSLGPRDPNFANDYLDFLGKNKTICKTALGHEWGPYGGLFDEKKPRVLKILWQCPFKPVFTNLFDNKSKI